MIKDCYEIIKDEKLLTDFIEWLPELEKGEKFYLALMARKKYDPESGLRNDKSQLRRFVSDKSRLLTKIRQLEIPVGHYGENVTQKSLCLYISPNPRSMRKATKELGKVAWDLMEKGDYNIHKEALSCIQRSKSRGIYVDFDIDDPYADLSLLETKLNFTYYHILSTGRGFHVLVEAKPENEVRKKFNLNMNWYMQMKNIYKIDNAGDELLPVPGTEKGGFIPRFIEI